MREIEFRAWDKDDKQWVDDVLLTCGKYNFIFRNIDRCEFVGEDRNIELCQYTGLKDKNGKKIFEGDILKIQSDARQYDPRIFEVYFDTTYLCYQLRNTNLGWQPSLWSEVIQEVSIPSCPTCSYKNASDIIGNIYEHPQLLSEKL